ncbi:MAG: hypothetical protein R6U85_08275 [Salinivirgaceae bacterium]
MNKKDEITRKHVESLIFDMFINWARYFNLYGFFDKLTRIAVTYPIQIFDSFDKMGATPNIQKLSVANLRLHRAESFLNLLQQEKSVQLSLRNGHMVGHLHQLIRLVEDHPELFLPDKNVKHEPTIEMRYAIHISESCIRIGIETSTPYFWELLHLIFSEYPMGNCELVSTLQKLNAHYE